MEALHELEMKEENMSDMIREAIQMLTDRKPKERALILAICKLNDGERGAIILADRLMRGDDE